MKGKDLMLRTDAAEAGVKAEEDNAQVSEHAANDDQIIQMR